MDERVMAALRRLPCVALSYDEWIRVGMALKAEGCGVDVWDDWSRGDPARYHEGECRRRWESFRGSHTPVTGATILHLARTHGAAYPALSGAGFMDGAGVDEAAGVDHVAGFMDAADFEDAASVMSAAGVDHTAGVMDAADITNAAGVRGLAGADHAAEVAGAVSVDHAAGVDHTADVMDAADIANAAGVRGLASVDHAAGVTGAVSVDHAAGVDPTADVMAAAGIANAAGVTGAVSVNDAMGFSAAAASVDAAAGVTNAAGCAGAADVDHVASVPDPASVEHAAGSAGTTGVYHAASGAGAAGAVSTAGIAEAAGVTGETDGDQVAGAAGVDHAAGGANAAGVTYTSSIDDAADVPGVAGSLPARTPAEELRLYLETLFRPEERVGYVTGDAWQNADGKWVPARGVFDRTAGELIESLRRHPDDLGATVGDWHPEAGAWIRFNPLDGQGARDGNVTAFRYALVESDTMPAAEQAAAFRRLRLPIAAMVASGGKSVHAIVRVDASGPEEYRARVARLYEILAAYGVSVDPQNRNPSRLSRMPGVTRNGRPQRLLGVNLGETSWADWISRMDAPDGLPDMVSLAASAARPPALPEELICGVLRRGHKMLISGSSKAGKSFLLMELCAAIAEGLPWLGFPCRKGRVLYVNLEIDAASCFRRFMNIYQALGCAPGHMDDIMVWNLRGHAVPLDQLVPGLVRRARGQRLDAIVIDPIYKVITGDENSATDMAAFCNQFDRICNETGCAVIYCHHHSKGAQGAKRPMDRASGSGVFARDPDAQLDMIELELTDDLRNMVADRSATAWRMESSLREFPIFAPVHFWFEYPVHRLDRDGDLRDLPVQGSPQAGRMLNSRCKTSEEAGDDFRNAFFAQAADGSVSVQDIMDYLSISDKTVYARLKKLNGEFVLKKGRIYQADDPAVTGITPA